MTDCRLSVTWKDQPGHINGAVQSLYREMVRSLLFYSFMDSPRFRYLKQTISEGITYSLNMDEFPVNTLWGFVESDWAGCPDTRRSTSGFFFILNGAAISWKSKRQTSIALSTAEAEFCFING